MKQLIFGLLLSLGLSGYSNASVHGGGFPFTKFVMINLDTGELRSQQTTKMAEHISRHGTVVSAYLYQGERYIVKAIP